MNKIKLVTLATTLGSLALSACSGSGKYYGAYTFQMGKKNGAHMGITMNLTSEKITVEVDEEQKTFEKFDITLSLPDNPEFTEGGGISSSLLSILGDSVSGGYEIEEETEGIHNKFNLYPVIDISEIAEGGDEEEGEEESSSSSSESTESTESSSLQPLVIDSRFVDDIMIATYGGKSISVTVPVSLTDLMFQLYWYGFDLFDPIGEQPVAHDHGTHPTKEDVAKINETYNKGLIPHYDLDALVKYGVMKEINYRDFYTLTMGLAKEEKK